jgi:hypothetical protein
MAEYKINSYMAQKLDNRTLLPKGRKRTMFSVAEKKHPFPNKSIFLWETVKDGFRTEQEAKLFLENLKG